MPSARRRRTVSISKRSLHAQTNNFQLPDGDSEDDDDVRPTQRRRGSPSENEEDEEEEGEAMDEGQEGDAQVVKRFVRYALACEFQRKYIRRADVTEKGLYCQS